MRDGGGAGAIQLQQSIWRKYGRSGATVGQSIRESASIHTSNVVGVTVLRKSKEHHRLSIDLGGGAGQSKGLRGENNISIEPHWDLSSFGCARLLTVYHTLGVRYRLIHYDFSTNKHGLYNITQIGETGKGSLAILQRVIGVDKLPYLLSILGGLGWKT